MYKLNLHIVLHEVTNTALQAWYLVGIDENSFAARKLSGSENIESNVVYLLLVHHTLYPAPAVAWLIGVNLGFPSGV
jgi:hypothetical protein